MKTPFHLLVPLAAFTLLAGNPALRGQGLTTVSTLYSFTGGAASGTRPATPLIQGADGNFYGTTSQGGSGNLGTVFQLTPAGAFTLLHGFTGTDGSRPEGGLVQATDGNFYGTTDTGGTAAGGTIFKITPAGVLTTLHSFTGAGADGRSPEASLVQGSDGNFYGTTSAGGDNGVGTVFQITPAGIYNTLYSFADNNGNGDVPYSNLIQGSDGNFYGTTSAGGSGNNAGTVFRITPAGNLTTLHVFTGTPTDGMRSFAGLVQGSDGNFYGTTDVGGDNNAGTVFRISPTGGFTQLYSFSLTGLDQARPEGTLVQGSDGSFYSTASGGNGGAGTVFRIKPSGDFTTLYTFTQEGTDGGTPFTGLLRARDGNLYGTTFVGGSADLGTVFRVILAKPPVITSALSVSATIGQAFTYQITATNAPTSFSTNIIPAGLRFSTSTGAYTGTPSNPGTYAPTITASNDAGTGSATLNLVIRQPAPVITSATSATGKVGVAFAYQVTATGSPTSFATSSIPPGLTFSASTGKLTGRPTKAGTYKPLLSATNAGGTGRINLNLTVNPASPAITSTLTAAAATGTAFAYQITASNTPTSYGASGLPAGLSINQATGKITGTPTKAGTFSVTIAAFNAGGSGSAKLALKVNLGKPAITSALSAGATSGVAFSYQIIATNSPTSYGASGLPAGLTINRTTGKITGTPTSTGAFTVTIAAFNSAGSGSAKVTLTIGS